MSEIKEEQLTIEEVETLISIVETGINNFPTKEELLRDAVESVPVVSMMKKALNEIPKSHPERENMENKLEGLIQKLMKELSDSADAINTEHLRMRKILPIIRTKLLLMKNDLIQ